MSTPVDPPSELPPPAAADASAEDASLRDIAHEGVEYLRNLIQLFMGELEIARGSFTRMLIAGALIPVFLLTIWTALNLLLGGLVARWLGDWLYGYLAILIINIALVALSVYGWTRWKRDLTLPRTRDALARLLERVR